MGTAAALAIGGGLLSGSGSKKASKNQPPNPFDLFARPIRSASGLLNDRLLNGFQRFPGQLSAAAGEFGTSLFGGIPGFSRDLLSGFAGSGAGQGALDALGNIAGGNAFSDENLAGIRALLDPIFGRQREQGLQQVREGEAQGGRTFSTGGVGAETDFISQLGANQAQQTIQSLFQSRDQQIAASQGIPQFLQGILGAFQQGQSIDDFARQLEQQGIDRRLAEFIRTQPENAIPLLASLLGNTPFAPQQSTSGSFLSGLGGGLSAAAGGFA